MSLHILMDLSFGEWLFTETTSNGLYHSAVRAFPRTTKRQHHIDFIDITRLEWVPFVGMKTLYVKGLAQNTENGREYTPMVLFKNVRYHPARHGDMVEIVANDNKHYVLERLGQDTN